CHQHNSYPFTF
nr:immunoglobulin light chain junction region [Macaca mulatta]